MSTPVEQHPARVEATDFPLSSGGVLAQLTLRTDSDRPVTLGPAGLENLRAALEATSERARNGEIRAVAVIGTEPYFVAGADLTFMDTIETRERAVELGAAGHDVFNLLADMPVATFAFISGAALGGGLELALHADYRAILDGAAPLALPEVSLGIIPGWGGCWRLPRLIGIERAIEVIIANPLRNNRQLPPARALEMGIVDVTLPAEDFAVHARGWAEQVLTGDFKIERPAKIEQSEVESAHVWDRAISRTRSAVDAQLHGAAPAPYRALELLTTARAADRAQGYEAENESLGDLLLSPEFRASLYGFHLVNRARRAPAAVQGAPETSAAAVPAPPARFPARAGVVGAGLMAWQLARVISQNLEIEVVMRDLDSDRVASGLAALRASIEKDVAAGRLSDREAQDIAARVHGTTELADFSDCELVIEAVTEKIEVKKAVFAELETVLAGDAVLATNTSALSVTEMARDLQNPERVIGLHFFNPVARMPLVEVVRTAHTSASTLTTALAVVHKLRKSGVVVADAPGFVVNRILLRFLGEIFAAADRGVPLSTVEEAVRPMGLPMSPLALLDLVGPAVANYVLIALRSGLGPRYALSRGLQTIVANNLPVFTETGAIAPETISAFSATATAPDSAADVLAGVQEALGDEVARMLDEGVVSNREDIDLCMILGAGWPLFLGGITPYLERVGALPKSA